MMNRVEMQSQVTKRQVLGQVFICSGCCCGKTEKGKPEVPVDWLKTSWKEARLKHAIQLTISGCLGPCDLVNVVAILIPDRQIWLGGLTERFHYEALFEWSKASVAAGYLLDLPEMLADLVFERYQTSE